MAVQKGDRVEWRGKYGILKDIWTQEDPAPTLGIIAFDSDPMNPLQVPLIEIIAAADAPPPAGTPWAQAVADLATARTRISQLETENAQLRAQIAGNGGGNP